MPPANAGEGALSEFALSFDGYAAFGVQPVLDMNAAASRRYAKTGRLPHNLAVLRGCLFSEQRAARFTDSGFGGDYVTALLEAIRRQAPAT